MSHNESYIEVAKVNEIPSGKIDETRSQGRRGHSKNKTVGLSSRDLLLGQMPSEPIYYKVEACA
jgi:hypothetical protein